MHEVVRGMIDYVVNDVITTSRIAIESTAPTTIDEVRAPAGRLSASAPRRARARWSSRASCVSMSIGTRRCSA